VQEELPQVSRSKAESDIEVGLVLQDEAHVLAEILGPYLQKAAPCSNLVLKATRYFIDKE
jgi:hypothetical protein